MKVGVIGLGVMGQGMAANLARAGCLVGVWNRTVSRSNAFASSFPVPIAQNPADLAERAEVVITCVSADEDLNEVIDAMEPGMHPGQVIIDTSTVAVETVEALSHRLSALKVGFLDAPVTGGAEGAEAGTLQVMVGGEAPVLDQVVPVFNIIAAEVTHFGPVGYGQRAKAVNQVLAAGMVQAITEALAFADASGLDTSRLLPVLSKGAVGSRMLERRGERMLAGDFAPGFRMALHHKDLNLCRGLLQSLDVNLPIVEMTIKHYERLFAQGMGDQDMTALYQLKRDLFKTGNRRSL